MMLTTPDILKGIVLLGAIAHVMIYFNGLWHDIFVMSALLSVGIPIVIYKFLLKGKKKQSRRSSSQTLDI